MTFDSSDLLERLRALTAAAPPARWLVAFSGGIDSSVLLHALAKSSTTAEILAIHIDHGLHADSAGWEQHCQAFAASLGVDYQGQAVVVPKKNQYGPEAAARRARYDVFLGLVQTEDCLLSGHHEDDQAETLLLNLMRGSGPAGLAGIGLQQSFGRGRLLRPMLGVSGEAIHDYATRHGLSWIEDPSNADSRFDRNYLRNEVLPKLAARWPAVANRLRRSAELIGESSELLNDLADIDLLSLGGPQKLFIGDLLKLTAARQRNVLRRAVRLCGLPAPPATRLYQVINELLSARADAEPLVEWDRTCIRRYREHLYVMSPPLQSAAKKDGGKLPANGKALSLGPGRGSLTLSTVPGEGIDPMLAGEALTVHYRGGGETIRINRLGHTKKLKKLLQEEGVVPWMRGALPLLFAGTRLVAVADLWTDADCTASPGLKVNWSDRPALK
jgi:tRNA(Ile)-lysidine synthase